MKTILALFFLAFPVCVSAADITPEVKRPDGPSSVRLHYRDRGTATTTYAPTYNAESNFSYKQGNTTTTVSAVPGLFHSVVISSGVGNGAGFIIYDSTHTGDTTRPIAKFPNATDIEGSYLFDVQVTSGIQVISPSSTNEWTISYR